MLAAALARTVRLWPQADLGVGAGGEVWVLVADHFASDAAIEDMPAYQRSFTPDLDRKGQAAYAIGDYSYMFAIAAVAPLVGFGLLPFPEAPEWSVGFGGTYAFRNGLYLGADAKYTSSYLARFGMLPLVQLMTCLAPRRGRAVGVLRARTFVRATLPVSGC